MKFDATDAKKQRTQGMSDSSEIIAACNEVMNSNFSAMAQQLGWQRVLPGDRFEPLPDNYLLIVAMPWSRRDMRFLDFLAQSDFWHSRKVYIAGGEAPLSELPFPLPSHHVGYQPPWIFAFERGVLKGYWEGLDLLPLSAKVVDNPDLLSEMLHERMRIAEVTEETWQKVSGSTWSKFVERTRLRLRVLGLKE